MVIAPFEISRIPAIVFGEGALRRLPDVIAASGRKLLVVTGARSFPDSRHWPALEASLRQRGLVWEMVRVDGEPSPQVVDDAVARFRGAGIETVVGIGGGSALDAAKAIAALLRTGRSVMDHLEGVGRGVSYTGPAVPFIAVPTTAGTGSEATKNAVLSVRGEGGFKRSFRHDDLMARQAIVDPLLLESCPPRLIAAEGMDALTQLLEAYVSTRSHALTDALAETGLDAAGRGLLASYEGGPEARAGRSRMAYAALLSGIVLSQVGLGSVHGLAAPLGAFFPVPHGLACGTLVASAVAVNVEAMRSRDARNPALAKYARARAILSGSAGNGDSDSPEKLALLLDDWIARLEIPRLGTFGVREADIPRVVAASRGGSMRTNAIVLRDEEIGEIVRRRL